MNNMKLMLCFYKEVQQAVIIVLDGLHKDTPSHVHRIVKKADEEEADREGRPRKYSFSPAQCNDMFDRGITIKEIASSSEPKMNRNYVAAMIDKYRADAGLTTRPKVDRKYTSMRQGLGKATLLRVAEVEELMDKYPPTRIGTMLDIHHNTVSRIIKHINNLRGETT